MLKPNRRFHRSNRYNTGNFSIALLLAAGTGALLFTLSAGIFVYGNTLRLVAAKDWVEHTQDVLTSLRTASQLTDRIEFSTRLYALNRSESQLSMAQSSAIQMESLALHVKALVADNAGQVQNAAKLTACAGNLNSEVRALPAQSLVSADSLLRCHEILSLMAEQEQVLLKERTRKSQHSSFISLAAGGAFVALSLLSLLVLFGLLLRDALLRRRIARITVRTNENLKASVLALEENVAESHLLTSCRDELQLCVEVQQVYRTAANCLARLLPRSTGSLCMINNSRNMVEVASTWGKTSNQASTATTAIFSPDSCCGLRLGQPRWRRPGTSEVDCAHFLHSAPSYYLCVPMVAQGDTLGVLYIECADEDAYRAVDRRMDGMLQLLQLTSMTIASLNLRTKLENQSIRDSLTGLFNRHFMEIVLARELSRAARQKTSLAVFMLDVDHFKRFNDSFGHAAGDAMLKAVAEVFNANVRTEDTVCRYGGEEFAIILPGITPEAAYHRAEVIREAITCIRLSLESTACSEATISIGIAFYPGDATEAEPLLRKADQALYRAKHNGRNQVCLSEVLVSI